MAEKNIDVEKMVVDLHRRGCLQFQEPGDRPHQYPSGVESAVFFDLSNIMSLDYFRKMPVYDQIELRRDVVRAYDYMVKPHKSMHIYGIPSVMTSITAAMAFQTGRSQLWANTFVNGSNFVKKIEGDVDFDETVVILAEAIDSEHSILNKGVDPLRRAGAHVVAVATLMDLQEGGEIPKDETFSQTLQFSLSNAVEILVENNRLDLKSVDHMNNVRESQDLEPIEV